MKINKKVVRLFPNQVLYVLMLMYKIKKLQQRLRTKFSMFGRCSKEGKEEPYMEFTDRKPKILVTEEEIRRKSGIV